VLKAQYVNGRSKAICVKNLSKEQVAEKMEFLLGNSGQKNVKLAGKKVVSQNESVRGVWSPMHGGIKKI
jgi:large subunit ribosomal protein L43